jgi:uncharacterized protein YlaN (UPF0358 family)
MEHAHTDPVQLDNDSLPQCNQQEEFVGDA